MRALLVLCALCLTMPVSAQTAYQKCTTEAGIQVDATGRRSIQTQWHFRTHEAFERCMDEFRKRGGPSVGTNMSSRSSSGNVLPAQTSNRTVVAGQSHKLAHFVSVNPDCSSRGMPHIKIIGAPKNGRITLIRAVDFSAGFSGNYTQCNSQRINGLTASYTAQRSFSGSDAARLLVIYPSGNTRQIAYSLAVSR